MASWRIALLLTFLFSTAIAAPANLDLTFVVPGVAIVVVIFLALANMLAHSISNPQMEAWVKTEIRELFAACLLIGTIVGLFIASQGIAKALTGQDSYVSAAQGILTSWLGPINGAYNDIILAANHLRIAATYSSGINIPIYWVSVNYQTGPLSGAAIFLTTLSLATQGLANGIFIIQGMDLLLAFLNIVVPKILLPISFCLRLVPFSRKLGNTLIAISIASIVFLPFSIIIADVMNDQVGMPQPALTDDDKSGLDSDPAPVYTLSPICEFEVLRLIFSLTDFGFAAITAILCGPWYGVCYPIILNPIYPILSIVFQILNGVTLIIWEAAQNPSNYGEAAFNALKNFLPQVNNLMMLIYLDFVLIAILTMTAAKSLSSALGGEWYMAGIQRLI